MEKEEDSQEKRRFAEVLGNLAATSSWHGVPKIVSSPQRAVKCLWCLFMMCALGMTLWNLSELFETFNDRPIQTTVSLEFSAQRFPAVSFCNMNPVRKSQIGRSPVLADALDGKTTPDDASATTTEFTSTSSNTSSTSSTTVSSSKYSNVTVDPNVPETQTFENMKTTEKTATAVPEEEEEQDPRRRWKEATTTFKTKFRSASVGLRMEMGHQKEDFIHRAVFSGKQLNVSENFKLFTSSDFGNCFTMDSPEYKAWRSGPEHGIKLRLNLEVDEYIKNFASGYGVRMVFHEPGTFPMPAEEGLTLSPGFESMIGLRVITISRLGKPFGHCTNGEEFQRLYNVSYSITSCMEFCRVKQTVAECNCIPFDAPDLNFGSELSACDNDNTTQYDCAQRVERTLASRPCNCESPCHEITYEKTTSGRRWPNKDYLEKVLMEDVCSRNQSSMEIACSQLISQNKSFDYERYRYNFVRARIYFEDLNYQKIKEVEFYKPVRFVCDIGGAMGLFLGGSLLSFLELFQLIMEVVLHMFRSKKKEPSESVMNGRNQPIERIDLKI